MLGQPIELGENGVELAARTRSARAHQEEPVGVAPQCVVEPAVIGAHAGAAHLGWPGPVARFEEESDDPAVSVVHKLASDAFSVHLGKPEIEVVQAPPVPRLVHAVGVEHVVLGVRPVEHKLHDEPVPLLFISELGEQVVVSGLEIVGPHLWRRLRMRIDRHDNQLVHRNPQTNRDKQRLTPR